MDRDRDRQRRRRLWATGWAWLLLGGAAVSSATEGGADPWLADVNRANQAELEMIKGVGPQLSTQILGERERAPFRDWADFIARLPGVGPAKARKLSAAGLRVNDQPLSGP